jgi:Reverse transcriptase (RNA-dependent DNA polymerase)
MTMCNVSLREGCLPVNQKAAIITPILKKTGLEADDVRSYRPISKLTFISKVIGRIVAAQIKAFLDDSDLMLPMQSTEAAVLKVMSHILDAVDSQDMSTAFDTLDFEISLRCLETSYRPNGTVLEWPTSFVTDRTHAVAFGGKTSSPVKLICGVPQGSVLGPLLFVLYAADVMKIAQSWCAHSRLCRPISAIRLST